MKLLIGFYAISKILKHKKLNLMRKVPPEDKNLRLSWKEHPKPELKIEVYTGRTWLTACVLKGENLTGVKLIGTRFGFDKTNVSWGFVERGDVFVLKGKISGREILREIKLDKENQLVSVKTSFTLLGDELLEFVQDIWMFSGEKPLDFTWVPNLRPEADMVIGDHVFRAPALILMKDKLWLALIPDLNLLSKLKKSRTTCLELNIKDEQKPLFGYGIKKYEPIFHTYYRHSPSMLMTPPAGKIKFGYEILVGFGDKRGEVLRKVTSYQWKKYARKYLDDVLPQVLPFFRYAEYTYPTVLKREFVEFKINGKDVGGFKALEDNRDYFRRPGDIVWNQVWFNGLRSAYGMWYFGRRLGKVKWVRKASKVKELTLQAPQICGLFPAIYDYKNNRWWGSVPRLNGGEKRIHIANASWTATWLIWWNENLEKDKRIKKYVNKFAEFLAENQLKSGAIPAWFDIVGDRIKPVDVLKESAETACPALFVGEFIKATGEKKYLPVLIKACDFLLAEVVPQMKYWDFETFFSCSWKPLDMRDPYTGVLPQNNYSTYWTAHALLQAYKLTGTKKYLTGALEAIDILNLYQQIWNPPWLDLYTFGGFGVMNTDGEWNDSRQAVFAPLYMEAYLVTGDVEYFQRGVSALRASFALFSVPENKKISPYTWNAYPVGLSPENFAHGGVNGTYGRSDFGWGAGGALASAAFVENKYGGIYIDVKRKNAFGIDGCKVVDIKQSTAGLKITVKEMLGFTRKVPVVSSEGNKMWIELKSKREKIFEVKT